MYIGYQFPIVKVKPFGITGLEYMGLSYQFPIVKVKLE